MEKREDQITKEELFLGVWMAGILVNLLLSVGKMVGGVFGRAPVLVIDSLRSLTDVWGELSFLVEADGQIEDKRWRYIWKMIGLCLGAAAILLLSLGYAFFRITTLWEEPTASLDSPRLVVLLIPALAILLKKAAFYYIRMVALETKSSAMMADSFRQRAEGMWSVLSLLALIGAILKVPYLEMVILVYLMGTIVRDTIGMMIDVIR